MRRKIETTVVRVGKRIREIRNSQKISQQELGERADLNYKFVGGIERGERNPSIETLRKVAHGLKVEVGELFRFETGRQLSERDRLLHSIIGLLGDKTSKELKLARRMLLSLFKDEV